MPEHGGLPGDCTLAGITATSICHALRSCDAATPAAELMNEMARQAGRLALVIMDSKVEDDWPSARRTAAGRNIVALLDRELFGRGYRGDVVIGAAKLSTADYVRAAAAAAAASPNRALYHFTIDQEPSRQDAVLRFLAQLTSNRVYGVGVSALSPRTYYAQISKAAANRNIGALGMVYIWTIDDDSPMGKYLTSGANGIMTNRPAVAARVLRGRRLARPGERIPAASRGPVHFEWIGTGPICRGNPGDCAARGMRYEGITSRSGDGAPCASGHKVLCSREIR